MKATGIVRRIDDLGRVVVPKEIRRTLRIREGDPLEIFTDREGEIILKKYSPIGELGLFAKQYAESLAQTTGHMVCVTDRDAIIATAGGAKKDYHGKSISIQLEQLIQNREKWGKWNRRLRRRPPGFWEDRWNSKVYCHELFFWRERGLFKPPESVMNEILKFSCYRCYHNKEL